MSASTSKMFGSMDLPGANRGNDLEQLSRNRLPDVFPIDRFEINHTKERDKGIDVTMDLRAGDRFPGVKLLVQLKSTETKRQKKDGSYSLPIRLSNINYLLNHKELSIYVFYVMNTDTFYYEWTDEFFQSISNTKNWKSKKTHSLSFRKKLTPEVANEIYARTISDGERHRAAREAALDIEAQKIVNSFHDQAESGKHPIESIEFLMESFEGLNVLPIHILAKLPPFSMNSASQSYYSEKHRELKTDNVELFTFFNNLGLKKGRLFTKVEDSRLDQLPNWEKRIKEILRFFHDNLIAHLSLVDRKNSDREWVHIHNFETGSQCDCEKCNFYRLNLSRAIALTRKRTTLTAKWKSLRRAYVHEELGEFKTAYELYSNLATTYLKKKKFVSYFICKYHLQKLKHFLEFYYFGFEKTTMLSEIKRIDLDGILINLQRNHGVKDEIIGVLRWISNGQFIYSQYQGIDRQLEEIGKIYENDQWGGYSSQEKYYDLVHQLSKLTVFVEGNLFPSNHFYGFDRAINKALEGVLMLYDLTNERSKKLKRLDYYIARVVLVHGDYDGVRDLFDKYRINCVELNQGDEKDLSSLIDNLIGSLKPAEPFVKEGDKTNHFMSERLNELISNLFLVLGYFNIDKDIRDDYLSRILDTIETLSFLYSRTASRLHDLLMNGPKFSLENYVKMYRMAVNDSKIDRDELIVDIPHVIKTHYKDFVLEDSDLINRILLPFQRQEGRRNLNQVIALHKIVDIKQRSDLANLIRAELSRNFDFFGYVNAIRFEIIDHTEFFEVFLASVPLSQNERDVQNHLFGNERDRNRRLNWFIDYAYKYGLNLKESRFQVLHQNEPYFKWLMNLEDFDYDKFNPFWVLEFQTESYFNEFRKYRKIRDAIAISIEKKPRLALMRVFHKISV